MKTAVNLTICAVCVLVFGYLLHLEFPLESNPVVHVVEVLKVKRFDNGASWVTVKNEENVKWRIRVRDGRTVPEVGEKWEIEIENRNGSLTEKGFFKKL